MSEDSSNTISQPTKPQGWGIIGGILLGGLAFIGPQMLVLLVAPLLLMALPEIKNVQNFGLHALYELLTIGVIIAFVQGYGLKLKDIGLGKFLPKYVMPALGGFLVYFGLSIAILLLVSQVIPVGNDPQELGFASPTILEGMLVFIALVVLAPLAEELLFRGFVFKGLRRRLQFPIAALVVSLLFALAHGQLNVGLDTFALSLVLCYLREKTKSLWPCIMLHAFKNAVAFFLLFVYTGPK